MQLQLSVPEEMLTLPNPGYETSVVNNNVFTGSFLAGDKYTEGCLPQTDSVWPTPHSRIGISTALLGNVGPYHKCLTELFFVRQECIGLNQSDSLFRIALK